MSTPSQSAAAVGMVFPELAVELSRQRFSGSHPLPPQQGREPACRDHLQKIGELPSFEPIDKSDSLAVLKYCGIALGILVVGYGLWLILPTAFPLMTGFFTFFGRDPVLIGLATFLQIALVLWGIVAFVVRKLKDD